MAVRAQRLVEETAAARQAVAVSARQPGHALDAQVLAAITAQAIAGEAPFALLNQRVGGDVAAVRAERKRRAALRAHRRRAIDRILARGALILFGHLLIFSSRL